MTTSPAKGESVTSETSISLSDDVRSMIALPDKMGEVGRGFHQKYASHLSASETGWVVLMSPAGCLFTFDATGASPGPVALPDVLLRQAMQAARMQERFCSGTMLEGEMR